MAVAVGIDACKRGWVAFVLRTRASPEVQFIALISELSAAVPDADAIGIDIPIGLPAADRRRADVDAKDFLGARRNSLFFVPVRAALEAETHLLGNAASVASCGYGMSQQAYALRSRIFEVESWLPDAPCPVWEVHPEVSFPLLAGGPAKATKKTWAGMVERRAALADRGIDVIDDLGEAAHEASVDDILDAAVSAWSARRALAGKARCFPDPPEIGVAGRPVAIWA